MQERVYRISVVRLVVLAVGFPVLAVGLPLLAVGLLDPELMELPLRSVPGVPAFMGAMLGLASFWAFWATGLEYHVTADEVVRRSRFGT